MNQAGRRAVREDVEEDEVEEWWYFLRSGALSLEPFTFI